MEDDKGHGGKGNERIGDSKTAWNRSKDGQEVYEQREGSKTFSQEEEVRGEHSLQVEGGSAGRGLPEILGI